MISSSKSFNPQEPPLSHEIMSHKESFSAGSFNKNELCSDESVTITTKDKLPKKSMEPETTKRDRKRTILTLQVPATAASSQTTQMTQENTIPPSSLTGGNTEGDDITGGDNGKDSWDYHKRQELKESVENMMEEIMNHFLSVLDSGDYETARWISQAIKKLVLELRSKCTSNESRNVKQKR